MIEANLVVAAFLCGLIWTIQVVHYPLFAMVPEAGWRAYEAAHQMRITLVVGPVMVANVVLAVAVALDGTGTLGVLNLALAAGVFAATGAVYAPMHGRLATAWDATLHRRLVALNWLRTAAWTAQTAVAVALLT
jgi:hypothetical protein